MEFMGALRGRVVGVHDRASMADGDIHMCAGISAVKVCRGFHDAKKSVIVGGWRFGAGLRWVLGRLWMRLVAWRFEKATDCNFCRAFPLIITCRRPVGACRVQV